LLHLRKRRAVLGLLLLISVWPFVHRELVRRVEVNPWKLGGFAMYATAVPPLQVIVFQATDEGVFPLDEERLPPVVRERLERFRIERHALGQLRSPDDVGRAIQAALPDLDWIVITVVRRTLDAETARMVETRARYRYQRPSIENQD
jgi:hypothetical protein